MIFKAENPNSYYSPFRDSFGSAMLEKTQPEVLHSRQFSSGYENNSISNDIFSHGHMQRIVNISNLPMQMEKPSHQPEYFYDTFYDVSTDLSSSLQGFSFFSHSRSDSVKINPHNRTQSDNPNENVEGKHTRLHYSGFDVFDLRPPPGFE